jgi:PAS domain S-box-containing protein
MIHGLFGPGIDRALAELEVQLALVTLLSALVGLGLALGVTAPLRQMAERFEAVASGDLSGGVDVQSTSEVDSLAGAFNEAISAVNRYIFQGMTGAVITLSPDGLVIGSSPAAEVVLGYREEEIVGKRFSDVFAASTEGRDALAMIEAAIGRRETVGAADVAIAAKDGRPVHIGLTVSYLRQRADGGRGARDTDAVGVMIAFKDLTEIRRLRDRLQQADQLVALGTLTAGVAHELRNPLASLQGLVELLGRDFAPDDPRRRYVSTMLGAVDRLNRLVEDLLLLSSPGAPADDLVDLNDLARETVGLARFGLGEGSAAIVCAAAPEPLVVMGSRDRLAQALTNIVINAVQATPAGGAIHVSTRQADGRAEIRVHNTGSYIDPADVGRMFVPFFTTKARGTGLGLAIARQIVTAHGGRIGVESARETGTTFTIDVPVARDGATAGGRVVPGTRAGRSTPRVA